ncbi:MAG TPA: hypothetical protein VGJ91_10055 [Polyangiaceae bacterium]
MVLEPPKGEHVLEALYGDDRFRVVVSALFEMVSFGALLVGVMRCAARSTELEMLPVLCRATALDSPQERERVRLVMGVRRVVVAAFGMMGVRGVSDDLAWRGALELLAVLLLRH